MKKNIYKIDLNPFTYPDFFRKSRVSSHGFFDNIIDDTSCTKYGLPPSFDNSLIKMISDKKIIIKLESEHVTLSLFMALFDYNSFLLSGDMVYFIGFGYDWKWVLTIGTKDKQIYDGYDKNGGKLFWHTHNQKTTKKHNMQKKELLKLLDMKKKWLEKFLKKLK